MKKVRVRFAPSPTGPLHIGGARSALFNYLYAKVNDGDFIVRIEDTDRERSTAESEENIKASLRWLGMDWNEGIDVGGAFAPYRQMERLDTYRQAVKQLLAQGAAYYCYCTEEEIEAERQALSAQGETPRYLGKCRNLTAQEIQAKEAQGIKPVIRFRVPADTEIVLQDQVRGEVSFDSNGMGDFVIMKSDGIPTYNFAVVVDDHLMAISHVIRGDEHLSNTPRQLLIYDALGWERPVFAHISLILGEDRAKMSKRNGSVSVVNYQNDGYLPNALVNFLALLGWASGTEEEIFSLAQLEKEFSLDHVSKSPAVFDMTKLKWLNGQYLHQLPVEEIAAGIQPYLEGQWEEERLFLLAETLRNHLNTFSEVKDYLSLIEGVDCGIDTEETQAILSGEHVPALLRRFRQGIADLDPLTAPAVKALLKAVGKALGIKGAMLFMPVRVACTGCQHGPDIDKLAALMGKDVLLARLDLRLAAITD